MHLAVPAICRCSGHPLGSRQSTSVARQPEFQTSASIRVAEVAALCIAVLRSSQRRRRPAPGHDSSCRAQGSEEEALMDDASLMAALRRRTEELEDANKKDSTRIAKNWREGEAVAGGFAVDDWVRRVALKGDDLFVGTASNGIRRYKLGSEAVLQRFKVLGDPQVLVPADHPADYDPETSVTSLEWDGLYLAAGLAGGRVHVWDEEGNMIFDRVFSDGAMPCYVSLQAGTLVAASGTYLLTWDIASGVKDEAEVSSRVHSLGRCPSGSYALGFADASIQLRNSKLELLSHQPGAHRYPVSACCATDFGLFTGDAGGHLVAWKASGEDREKLWSAHHENARVVAVAQGAGSTLVSAALDGTIRFWDAETGEGIFAIPGHKVWLGSICLDDKCAIMATDGRDNAVYVYNFAEEADQ